MRVVFLDFDGVLNSAASFLYEDRKRKKWKEAHPDLSSDESPYCPLNETLCYVCASNFQRILDECPDVKIVISSTWRNLFPMDWLKDRLATYGIDSSRVIGKTPKILRGFNSTDRGHEITEWLDEHPEVTNYVILDDNSDMTVHMHKFVQTSWDTGVLLPHVFDAIQILNGKKGCGNTDGPIPEDEETEGQ